MKTINPYQSPTMSGAARGHARFRLRRWFAAVLYITLFFLYLALLSDIFSATAFGILPFLIAIPTLMLVLLVSLLTRHQAAIRLDDSGIKYRDLVHVVDLSWDRVVGVVHQANKTLIASDSRLIQITISRRHPDYQEIVDTIGARESNFDFEVSDFRRPNPGK